MPEEYQSFASNVLFESIARCTKRQISLIWIINQRATLVNTFGRQFRPKTNFYVVQLVYNSTRFLFAVTATQMKK